MVLWGTDNLKSEGGPIAQALALMGARPRFDSYGRLAGAELIPLDELGRPRIDVVITLSGIFRDLLPLQIKLLAEAALPGRQRRRAARAELHPQARAGLQAEHGGDLETASLRVFGNAEGAYGSNVNSLIDNSRWDDADELAETYSRRKGFAYGRGGRPVQQAAAAAQRARRRAAGLPEPRFGRARRDHGRHLLRHAGRHQPRDQARQGGKARGADGAGLHRRPDPRRQRRRHGAHADRAGGAGNPHPHAEPEVVRGHAEARLRRRAPDRGARDQHDGLVGHDRPGRSRGSTSS